MSEPREDHERSEALLLFGACVFVAGILLGSLIGVAALRSVCAL